MFDLIERHQNAPERFYMLTCFSSFITPLNHSPGAENTHLQGKYHCIAGLLFGWIRVEQTSKYVI